MNIGSKLYRVYLKGLLYVLYYLINMYVFVCLRWCIFCNFFYNYMIIGVVVFGEIEGFWIIFSVLCFLVKVLIGYNYSES